MDSLDYKTVPKNVKLSEMISKKSLSSKDYSVLLQPCKTVKLRRLIEDYTVGDSLLSKDFLAPDVCNKFRFIKTANIISERVLLDFNHVEFCKPVSNVELENEDILIAKDGGGEEGLGEVSLYFKNDNFVDYICGEILRIKVKKSFDRWYLLGVLKSKHFKNYLDIVTPGGSTLRHSKLLALGYDVPIPAEQDSTMLKYVSLLVQNLIDKERNIASKRDAIDEIISSEINANNVLYNYGFTKRSDLFEYNCRIDTGIYNKEYKHLVDKIKNYKGGFYYLESKHVKPGRTPPDYVYTDQKRDDTYLWLTPSNIRSLELMYPMYIHTASLPSTRDYSVVLSAIRYLGYGYLVDKGDIVYSNQNTLVVNHRDDLMEQVFLLSFFTSTPGKELQYAWRVDGLVPIIYSEDFTKIPIPSLPDLLKELILKLYYRRQPRNIGNDFTNYLDCEKKRNECLGIYQLNSEIFHLRKRIDIAIDSIIRGNSVDIDLTS